MKPLVGPGPVTEGFGGRTKGNDGAREAELEQQLNLARSELAKLHEIRGSRVHSPEVLAVG